MIRNPLHDKPFDADAEMDDLEMARPSYDATSYARSGSVFRTSLFVIAIVIFSSLAAGLYFYAYQRGLEDGQREMPPVIAANPEPMRVSPEIAGEAPEPVEDLNIHRVIQGTSEAVPEPDMNDGRPESLLVGSNAVPQEAEVSAPEPQVENPAPPADVQPMVIAPIRPAEEVKQEPSVAAPASPQAAPEPSPKPTRQEATPATSRYMVQIAATRSRALARKTFADQAKKFPDLLGRRDPLILRADLGSKGIFYRVNVSGFSTRENAKQFCDDLTAAGGSCLVKIEPN